jgi:hypothetical protein
VLFGLIGLALAAVAAYAATDGIWLVTAAASVLAVWMAELTVRSLR